MNVHSNYKTVLIVDESHNIKNPELRKWASSALFLAPFAKRRVILSGTPMPNDAKDLWTQITFLWPHDFPLGNSRTYMDYVDHRGLGQHHRQTLNALFARIKKGDLGLPKPNFTEVPWISSLTAARETKGGQINFSILSILSSPLSMDLTSAVASFIVVFIFQLPEISGTRINLS